MSALHDATREPERAPDVATQDAAVDSDADASVADTAWAATADYQRADAADPSVGWQADAAELASQLGIAPTVRADADARLRTEAAGAAVVLEGSVIYVDPDQLPRGSKRGRELLAGKLLALAAAQGKHREIAALEQQAGDQQTAAQARRIAAARGRGAALPAASRAQLGAGFGTSVDDVRVHTDGDADALATDLDARAFAVGDDIFFGAGEYAPGSARGQHLLAHEVAHTIQQRDSAPVTQAKLTVSSEGDASEREADAAADAIAAGGVAPRLTATPTTIARDRRSNETDWMQTSAGSHDDQMDEHYKEGIFAKDYVALHDKNLVNQVGFSLLECPIRLPDYLSWQSSAHQFLVEIWEPVWAENDRAWDVLFGLLAPDSIITVIDTGRDCAPNPKGTEAWKAPVAWEMRKILSRRLLERLPRIAARWAEVKNQILLRKEAGEGLDREVTADEAPAGHPIDRLLLRGLNKTASLDTALYRNTNISERGQKDIKTTRTGLTYRFTGKTTRTGQDWIMVVEILEPANASREEVALELTGSTENAYLIEGAAPFYGVGGGLTPAARAKQIEQLGDSPVLVADDDPKAKDQMALASANGLGASPLVHADEKGKLAVLQRMSFMLDELRRCQGPTVNDDIGAAIGELSRRAECLRDAAPEEVVQWEAQTAGQLEIIQEAKAGIKGTGAYFNAFTADWPAAKGLIERVVGTFGVALRASSVVTEGQYHLGYAKTQQKLMEIDLIDLLLADLRRNLTRALPDHTKLDIVDKDEVRQLLGWENLLRERAVHVRELALTDPAGFQAELEKLRADVADLSIGTTLQVNMDQCDVLWRQLRDHINAAGVIGFTNDDKSRGMDATIEWDRQWNALYRRWKGGDAKEKEAVKAEMERLTAKGGPWEKLFGDIRAILENAQDIEKWVTLGIMIGIALITAGVGTLAELGGMGALGITMTEAAVFTTLSYAILTNPDDMSLGGFAKELVGNVIMFGALRMISMVYTGIVGKAAMQTIKGKAGLLLTQFVALNGYALYDAQTKKLAATGKNLTWGEVGEISLHNFIFMVAMTIGGTLMQRGVEGMKLRGFASKNIGRVKDLKNEIGELLARMEATQGADSEAAVELVGKQRELVDATGRALAELEPLARDAKRAKRANLDLAEFARLKAEYGEQLAQVEQAELMLAMEPAGTDTVFVRSDKMLDAYQHYSNQEGVTVGNEAVDPLTGAKSFEVTPEDGTPFKVIEKVGGGPVSRAAEAGATTTSEADAAGRGDYAQAARDAMTARTARLKAQVDAMEHPEFDVIDVGGGVSNLMVRASEARPGDASAPAADAVPRRITISEAPERWGTYADHPTGQAAPELNGPGLDVSRGTADQHGYVGSKVLGDAIVIGQYEQGVNIYEGKVTAGVEVKGSQPDWAVPGRQLRTKVGEKYFYGDAINLTTGPGPAAQAPDGWFPSKAVKDQMVGDGRVVYGDNHLANMKAGAGEVLVSGGSATAAWNAEAAARAGAKVTWVGRPSEPTPGTAEARELADIEAKLANLPRDSAEARELLDRARDLKAFRKAMLPRNQNPADSAFENDAIERHAGKVVKVEPADGGKVKITLDDGSAAIYDQLVVSHGQDPKGVGGLSNIIGDIKLKMIRSSTGKLCGLESVDPPGAVKLLGAAFAEPDLADHVVPSEQDLFVKLLEQQAAQLAADSRGVAPSIAMAAETIPLAMDVLAARDLRLQGAHGPLVLRPGEEAGWTHEIAKYFARELGVSIDRVTVKQLAGGRSGDSVYRIQLGEEEVGVFKVFADEAKAQTELDIMRTLASKELGKFDAVEAKGDAIKVDMAGTGKAGVLMETAKGRSVSKMVETLPEAGPARDFALAELERSVQQVAEALAEFHQKTGTGGEELDPLAKQNDTSYIRRKVEAAKDKLGDSYEPIKAGFEAAVTRFAEAKVPRAAYHGDANAGNFIVDGGKTGVIDVGTMKYGMDVATGEGTRTGAGDVARFLASLETLNPGKLTPAEFARLKTAFDGAYYKATDIKPADLEAAVAIYKIEVELAAMNGGDQTPADAIARIEQTLGISASGGHADPAGVLESGAREGEATPTEQNLQTGDVAMRQHPRFEDVIQQIENHGFNIAYVYSGQPKVEVTEYVDEDGKPIRTDQKVLLVEGMRFLDLEYQLDQVKALTERFDHPPAVERKVIQADGTVVDAKQRDGLVTDYQNMVIAYHDGLEAFLRLQDRGAGPSVLREHAELIRYHRENMKGADNKRRRDWRKQHFPDLPELEQKYDAIGGRLLEGNGP